MKAGRDSSVINKVSLQPFTASKILPIRKFSEQRSTRVLPPFSASQQVLFNNF